MDRRDEFKYILNFIDEAGEEIVSVIIGIKKDGYEDSTVFRQLRCLWTAYCLHCGYEPDTCDYDYAFYEVYEKLMEKTYVDYDSLDLYLGEYLS